jgi:hypothetical protein
MSIICSFFGHRNVSDNLRPALYAEIEKHITDKKVDTFYVGGYGQFDGLASGILHELKERYQHISVYRVLAYMPTDADKDTNGKQHPTLYPEGLETVPRKFAITHRNRWMVQASDYIIGYVQTSYGGACDALKYAEQQHKNITNLAQD